MLIRFLSNSVFFPLQFVMTYRSVLMMSAVILNQILFMKTVMIMYRFGRNILNCDLLAYKAALLFCINPASIFMAAPYSEILFSYLIFSGMHMFERNFTISASILFGLSALARSNGLLYFGLILHKKCKDIIHLLKLLNPTARADNWSIPTAVWSMLWIILLPVIIYLMLCASPFFLYQYLAYKWFCTETPSDIHTLIFEYGMSQGYRLKAYNSTVWCSDSIPLPYSYIQKNHWNVGFMTYYQLKQIPNFLLAAPVTLLSVSAIICYIRENWKTVRTLDLIEYFEESKKTDEVEQDEGVFKNRKLLPYIAHLVFLTVFGWLFIHIQVLTRMLFSSSPVLYWFTAKVITKDTTNKLKFNKWDVLRNYKRNNIPVLDNSDRNILVDQILSSRLDFKSKLVFVYFLGYFVVGTFLFSNFLPWT
ncbi:GPI mannosyltransferase 2-like isoform X2 [Argopecten irradians]